MRRTKLANSALAIVAAALAFPAAAQPKRSIDVGPPFQAELVADLQEPWAMTFLPDGRMLVTEKRGALHVVTQDAKFRRRSRGCQRWSTTSMAAWAMSCCAPVSPGIASST